MTSIESQTLMTRGRQRRLPAPSADGMIKNAIGPAGSRNTGVRSRVAPVAAIGLVGLGVVELALAMGAPLGRAVFGGAYTYLPAELRVLSAALAVLYVLAALVVLRRGGHPVPLISRRVSPTATWVLVVLLALGVVANATSSSPWERYLDTPVFAILALLCFVVAR